MFTTHMYNVWSENSKLKSVGRGVGNNNNNKTDRSSEGSGSRLH